MSAYIRKGSAIVSEETQTRSKNTIEQFIQGVEGPWQKVSTCKKYPGAYSPATKSRDATAMCDAIRVAQPHVAQCDKCYSLAMWQPRILEKCMF